MDRLSKAIINHKKMVMGLFILASLVTALMVPFVGVNYNISDYLPEKAESTIGIGVMQREFTQTIPNASVMVKDVSIIEALEIKKIIEDVEGVTEVLWLDSVVDLKQPLQIQDKEIVEGFYKEGNALFSVSVKEGKEAGAYNQLREITGPDGAVSGEVANLVDMQNSAVSEVALAVAILLPAIIIILILSTTSWLEPVLFLSAIGVSVIINMGTNIIFGEVSFITNSVSPILQLAVSMDYAIFLLHSFADFRKQYDDVEKAMYHAMKASVTTVAASASTTFFGFMALIFMDFRVGPDLGISLAKGIILSFVSVMIFLPALTLRLYKLIDRTSHPLLISEFRNISKYVSKLFIPVAIIVILIIVPSFLGQKQTSFIYGNSSDDVNREIGRSSVLINEQFGRNNILAMLVPKGEIVKEDLLATELEAYPLVKSVISYTKSVGGEIPMEFLDKEIINQFYSDNYARIILYTDMADEGEKTFKAMEEINSITKKYYDEFYIVGQSATLADMKKVVDVDNVRVNKIAIIAIFMVVALAFKSLIMPVILLLAIEVAIWINLSFPYFAGTSINFVGYLVLSTVQLGATIDYAILLSDTFIKNRSQTPLKEAISNSLATAFRSILVSASILSVAGFTLFATSSNSIVNDIGLLLGRGTLISMFMVVCFLPAMLIIFDKVIIKENSFKKKFLSGGKNEAKQ